MKKKGFFSKKKEQIEEISDNIYIKECETQLLIFIFNNIFYHFDFMKQNHSFIFFFHLFKVEIPVEKKKEYKLQSKKSKEIDLQINKSIKTNKKICKLMVEGDTSKFAVLNQLVKTFNHFNFVLIVRINTENT